MRPILILIGLLVAAAVPPSHAQDQSQFDLRFRGITVAEITLAARETPASYSLAGRLTSTGMMRLFARVRFDTQVEGHRQALDFAPQRYREDIDTGRRISSVDLRWQGGAPTRLTQVPAPDTYAVPATEAVGTIDPLTAIWRVLRSAPEAELCYFELQVYDGARRSQLSLGPRERDGARLSCAGQYRRIAGFSAEDMAERQEFPFTAEYTRQGDLWLLTDLRATSLLGAIRITRRD